MLLVRSLDRDGGGLDLVTIPCFLFLFSEYGSLFLFSVWLMFDTLIISLICLLALALDMDMGWFSC